MELKDILTLIQTVSDSNLTSFDYQEGNLKLSIQVNHNERCVGEKPVLIQQEVILQDTKEKTDSCYTITSPMVGTFYSAKSEDSKPFIQVGDHVKKGQVIGIVEAMKLMNEIESPYEGIVEEILVKNQEMVGFEQLLVRIRS